MKLLRIAATVVLLIILTTCAFAAGAVIETTQKAPDGRTIMCMQGGLFSAVDDCGVNAMSYEYVFIGTISSISPIEDHESKVTIMPEEVFFGAPPAPLVAVTSQRDCMPEIKAGERWLFYLQQDKKTLHFGYGGRSSPVESAQKAIETLRKLKAIGNFGILQGQVFEGELQGRHSGQGGLVTNARIHATNTQGGSFTTVTDADGHYEFQPLPSGDYKLHVDPTASVHITDSEAKITAGSCTDLTLTHQKIGAIEGRVMNIDGSPVAKALILIIYDDGNTWDSAETDAKGHYEFDYLAVGKYVVALDPPRSPTPHLSKDNSKLILPPALIYYGGATRFTDAQAIKVETDQKRSRIDFTFPPH